MEAIISAAETGFTGSLVGSIVCLCAGLTMLRVSMPRQQSRALLQCEPPHWYRRPRASWMSCSCIHTLPRPPDLQQPTRQSHTVAATTHDVKHAEEAFSRDVLLFLTF
uniref:Uncharacterized protein n=1 Tax=Amphiprion ocellaris TaxID=80972 RepID=A0A3Q1CVZ6_AMPOC